MPRLLTLGTLHWTGEAFGREKPLLLLAFLALGGPQTRREVARKFWPSASNPMNSLSVAVGQLKRAAPDLLQVTETQVGAQVACDALDLQEALRRNDLQAAQVLYRGPFLHGLALAELGEELEEWVMQTRESLAASYRTLLLQEAQRQLASHPSEAGQWAAQAYALLGAAPPSAEEFRALYALLSAADHPDRQKLAREAAELGLTLQAPPRPATPLLGREAELERLAQLGPSETLWLRGAAGMGKTALLRTLALRGGTLLSGRGVRPYQTLLALAPEAAHPQNEADWLAHLSHHQAPLLVDDWEAADPESRRVLLGLAQSRAGGPLVFASRERPPISLSELTLRPLAKEHLSDAAWERSGGLPALLRANTESELAESYANLLTPLTPRARQLLACLVVQPRPNRQATSRALSLSADDMAELLETLGRACLLHDTRPTAPTAARAWLGSQPTLETEVLTLLAPHLGAAEALPLYLRAHELTGSNDFAGFQEALEKHARTLLETGRDSEAEALLGKHALSEENRLLRARSLDALGRYPEALSALESLESSPLTEVFRGKALFRLGQLLEAERAAEKALTGSVEARARGHDLLGAIALAKGQQAQAAEAYERAAGLFLLRGQSDSRLNSMCTQAVALSTLGPAEQRRADEIKRQVLELSQTTRSPLVLINISWLFDRSENPETALQLAERAVALAEHSQQASLSALAWNNVGVFQQKLGHLPEAETAYQNAIRHAQNTNDVRTLALALGNLAELKESVPLIEEVILLLQNAGQSDLVAYFEEQRQAFMGRSGGA